MRGCYYWDDGMIGRQDLYCTCMISTAKAFCGGLLCGAFRDAHEVVDLFTTLAHGIIKLVSHITII
jgi:hypothetical protein